jgi:serine/threonine protein kinase
MRVTDLNGPEFVGTPEYMSPEMIIGKPEATFSADLWTVGVILFQVRLANPCVFCLLSSLFS